MFRNFFHTLFNSTPTEEEKKRAAEVASTALWGDEEFKKQAEKLEAKRKEAIERLGEKWLLHPANFKKKLDIKENSLGFKSV